MVNVSAPLKESQVKKYVEELNKYQGTRFYIHPTFNYTLEDFPSEINFELLEDEELYKLIPIVKDIDNPNSINNKFKLGIITTSVKSYSVDS